MRTATCRSVWPAGFPARRRSARACGPRRTAWRTCWRSEDRPPQDRRQHRMGAFAHRRDAARDALSQVDVFARQAERKAEGVTGLDPLLSIPVAAGVNWSEDEIRAELDNNAQGHPWLCRALGRSGRRLLQGAGHQRHRPDGRPRHAAHFSSQHMANWLLHGVVSEADIDAAFARMAKKVDAQNAGDPLYRRPCRRSCRRRNCADLAQGSRPMPPVMYSQPLEPQPSTTTCAPELRTAKRSPAWPAANSLPGVAP
jgi:hypothetical protein